MGLEYDVQRAVMKLRGNIEEGAIGGLLGASTVGLVTVGIERGVDTASIMTLIGAALGSAVTVALAAGLADRKERIARDRERNEIGICVGTIWRAVNVTDIDTRPTKDRWNELVSYGANLREVARLEYSLIQEALTHATTLTLGERAGLRALMTASDAYEAIYDLPEPEWPEEELDFLLVLTRGARQIRHACQACRASL